MDILIKKEIALHQFEVRQNIDEVTKLIHPNFREVGKSGTSFNFNSIIEMMQSEEPSSGYLHSQGYETIKLDETVYLLLYKSAWVDESGQVRNYAKRSSIWVFSCDSWLLQYHQGTPCSEFELCP